MPVRPARSTNRTRATCRIDSQRNDDEADVEIGIVEAEYDGIARQPEELRIHVVAHA